MQGKYENKKEAVTEEMEVEASKMEKDVEEDFGVNSIATSILFWLTLVNTENWKRPGFFTLIEFAIRR